MGITCRGRTRSRDSGRQSLTGSGCGTAAESGTIYGLCGCKKSPAVGGGGEGSKGKLTTLKTLYNERKCKSNMTEALNIETSDIDYDAKALWAINRIRELNEERDELVEWYKQKTKEIKDQTAFDIANIERELGEYFKTVPHHKTKTQESYQLPGAKLILKKQNPEYKRNDDDVIAWLKSKMGGKYVKVEESLDWDGLKKNSAALDGRLWSEDGEEIPGIEVVNREPKFVVEV